MELAHPMQEVGGQLQGFRGSVLWGWGGGLRIDSDGGGVKFDQGLDEALAPSLVLSFVDSNQLDFYSLEKWLGVHGERTHLPLIYFKRYRFRALQLAQHSPPQ
jgi:hypothetical protein